MYVREQAKYGCNIMLWITIICIFSVLLGFGWLVVYPYYNDLQNAAIRSGYEYQTTKLEVQYQLIQDWKELDTKISTAPNADIASKYRAQQRGIIKNLSTNVKMMREVPPDITQFINSHQGE